MCIKEISFSSALMFVLLSCTHTIVNESECGNGTILTGTAVGAVAGGIIGELSGTRTAGLIVGTVLGSVHGYYLEEQQCMYYNKEQVLLEDILKARIYQSSLVKEINGLSQEMTLLFQEIENLKNKKNMEQEKESKLLEKIVLKRLEIEEVYAFNQAVKKDVEKYRNRLLLVKYHQKDKKNLNKTLLDILKIQEQISSSCRYNLVQLKKFEKRILDV